MADLLVDVRQSLGPAAHNADMPLKEAQPEQPGSEIQAALPASKEDAQPLPCPSEAIEAKRQRTDDSAGLLPSGLPTSQKSSEDAESPASVPEQPQTVNGLAGEDCKQEVSPKKQVSKLDDGPSTSGQSGPVSLRREWKDLQMLEPFIIRSFLHGGCKMKCLMLRHTRLFPSYLDKDGLIQTSLRLCML